VSWSPVLLTLKVAVLATLLALLIGIPVAWLLARRKLPLTDFLSSVVTLPMVLPPTVLGYYLLLLIGRQSVLGRFLEERWGITLVFTWQAAVLASALVAVPLVVRSTQAAFETVDRDLEDAARTFGGSEWAVFLQVTIPLARRGILAGTILAFARAMGEFGATLMVAGNIPNQTQTLSIAIYDAVQAGNDSLAAALVLLISVLTVSVLVVVSRLGRVPGW
jgi:molybdate transport system permease protein